MQHRGVSLLEALVTLLIAAVTLAMAVPAVGRLALDARRTSEVNTLVTAIQLARSESAKRGLPVVVCSMAAEAACSSDANTFAAGWLVFVNRDNDSPPEVDAGEAVLLNHVTETGLTIRSNRRLYIFRPYFRRSTNGTITFCDRRGPDEARAVVVSYTGRPRVSTHGPGGRALDCAG